MKRQLYTMENDQMNSEKGEESRKKFWHPTKYEVRGGKIRSASSVGAGSRLVADLQGSAYSDLIAKFAHGRLADLGCGNAPLTMLYRDLVDEYDWVDWPNSAHQKFEIDIECDLNQRLPFRENSYDTILLTDVLEHICHPSNLIHELHRILDVDGVLVLGVPFLYGIHEEPHDYFRYTRYQLEEMAIANGFVVEQISIVGGGLDAWVDLSSKLVAGLWKPLGLIAYYSWSLLRRVSFIRSINERSAEKFPLAYTAVLRKKG